MPKTNNNECSNVEFAGTTVWFFALWLRGGATISGPRPQKDEAIADGKKHPGAHWVPGISILPTSANQYDYTHPDQHQQADDNKH